MMLYQKSPIMDKDETAVLLVTTITPPLTTTTMMGHGLNRMVAIVAGMMLLAGGVVLMVKTTVSGHTTTTVEGLVVGTQGRASYDPFQSSFPDSAAPCLVADGAFGGVSTDFTSWDLSAGQTDSFETCYQLGSDFIYCWPKSYHNNCNGLIEYRQCIPIGSDWSPVDPKYVNPVTTPYSCGMPCQDMYQAST